MSKSVPSDGRVNELIRAVCLREGGLSTYPRSEVDAVITDDRLKACDYSTLCRLAHEYREAFGQMHLATQKHLEAKAWQSSNFREYMGARPKGKRRRAVSTDGDPLLALAGTPAAPDEAPAPAERAANTSAALDNAPEPPAVLQPVPDAPADLEPAAEPSGELQPVGAVSELDELLGQLTEAD